MKSVTFATPSKLQILVKDFTYTFEITDKSIIIEIDHPGYYSTENVIIPERVFKTFLLTSVEEYA